MRQVEVLDCRKPHALGGLLGLLFRKPPMHLRLIRLRLLDDFSGSCHSIIKQIFELGRASLAGLEGPATLCQYIAEAKVFQ